MKKIVHLLAVFLVVTSVFCNQNYYKDLKKEIKKSSVVFIGIDGSGSYNFFDKGKLQVERLIKFTPPSTYVFIRMLTSDSYIDSNSIVTKLIPLDMSNTNDNPFNTKERIKKRVYQHQIKKAKTEILTKVSESEYPESGQTDIYGFLLYVQETIGNFESKEKDIYIIVLSDLRNNVNKYKKWLVNNSLKDIKVYLCVYQQTTPANKRIWIKIFQNLGVPKVQLYGVDQEIPNIFKQNEVYMGNPKVK